MEFQHIFFLLKFKGFCCHFHKTTYYITEYVSMNSILIDRKTITVILHVHPNTKNKISQKRFVLQNAYFSRHGRTVNFFQSS